MKKLLSLAFVLAASCALLFSAETTTLPFVSNVIGEHMVLQREKQNHVWGWTQPGAEVRLQIGGTAAKTKAGPDGRWQIDFTPPPAGGPYTVKIDGPQHVEFKDILVGDVWLCSGQSNMEFALAHAKNGAEAVKAANIPGIRFFKVASKASYDLLPNVNGAWKVCSSESVAADGGLSAVAFFFARKIHQETGVPIGLIHDALGGTPAESWMNPDTLKKMPDFTASITEMERLKARGGEQYGNYINHWYDEFDRGQAQGWDKEKFDDSAWKATSLKTGFTDLGVPTEPAVCWFRSEVELPDPIPSGTAKILLGIVERMDSVYINGRWIGASSWVENPRAYPIPQGVLRPGKNSVVIRVLKTKPVGGFLTPQEDLKITLGDNTAIALPVNWKGALSVDARAPHPLPLGYENWPTMPGVLYLGMLRPIAPLAIRGALWYQGEANQVRPMQYRTLLPAMIADWRALFNQGDFPFYIVSLPGFMKRHVQAGESDGWTGVREAQSLTAQQVKNSGLAVAIDLGDADNIHPTDKEPVGERLALVALKNTYHRDVVCAGPTFSRLEMLPGALRIHFSNTAGGLVVKGEKLGEFAIAGEDHVWHWAEAKIDGETVVVSAPEVAKPVAVRYAWQANPVATLFNGTGLPAEPFRTDDWDANPNNLPSHSYHN
jgi:sialate O-acetylesterase